MVQKLAVMNVNKGMGTFQIQIFLLKAHKEAEYQGLPKQII